MYKNYWLDKKKEKELPPVIPVVDWGVPPVVSCVITIQSPTFIETPPPLYISDKIEVNIPPVITINPPTGEVFYITVPEIPEINLDFFISDRIEIPVDIQLPPIVFNCLDIDFS